MKSADDHKAETEIFKHYGFDVGEPIHLFVVEGDLEYFDPTLALLKKKLGTSDPFELRYLTMTLHVTVDTLAAVWYDTGKLSGWRFEGALVNTVPGRIRVFFTYNEGTILGPAFETGYIQRIAAAPDPDGFVVFGPYPYDDDPADEPED